MKTLLIAGILCVGMTVTAQTWVKTSAPSNIQYKEIRTYGKDIIYAFGKSPNETSPQTLVSSFDGGQTWKVGSIPLLYETYLVATPAGLVGGNGGFTNPTSNYTDDGGITWKSVTGTETGYFFPAGILPNGKLLYSDQLYKTLSVSPDYTSLGSTYSTAVTPDFTHFAINPSGRIIFGHAGNFGYDLVYSDDNGATLTNISLKNIIGASKIAHMVTYAGNNTFYTAGVNTDVLKSTDNGATWTACTTITDGTYIASLKANIFGRLIVSKTGNIFKTSTDGGQTFSDIKNGLPTNGNGTLGVTTDGKFWLAYIDGGNGTNTGGIYYLQDNLSVSENNKKNIKVYPNPAKDFVKVIAENGKKITSVQLYTTGGNLIKQSIPDNNSEIDVKNLPKGVYILKLQTDNSAEYPMKFIKE